MEPDSPCLCGHAFGEHDELGVCTIAACDCIHFEEDAG